MADSNGKKEHPFYPHISDDDAAYLRQRIGAYETEVAGVDLHSLVDSSDLGALQQYILDTKYWALPSTVWQEVLGLTKINEKKYQPEKFDCDDFALSLKAVCSRALGTNAVGWVIDYSGAHSYSALLSYDPEDATQALHILLVEPQTDQLVHAHTGHYLAETGFVIW